MRKAMTSLSIGLTLVAATLVVTPSSATASLDQCARSNFCAWSDDGFAGGFAQWAGNDADWTNDGMHDNAESVFNNAASSSTVPDNVQVFEDVNFGNLDICVLPGETYDAAMDDNDYDSHAWVHSC